MQKIAASGQDEASDLHTSLGEVVRRVDLDRAAGAPWRSGAGDPRVAGYDGVRLARAALAGDQAALDEFHDLAGLVLSGVTEYGECAVVRLTQAEPGYPSGDGRAAFRATNEDGHNSTAIDAAQLVAWSLSPDGRAALARRGVVVPALATDLPAGILTPEEAITRGTTGTHPVAGFYWAKVRGQAEWTVARVARVADDSLVEVVGEAVDRSDYFGETVIVEWGPRLEPPR